MKKEDKVVTRFAPSPTGFMHVGSVRTALYAWAYAKKYNGSFILRIEDTDKDREVEGSIEHIMESLKWLGITWNEGPDIGGPNAPYIQSERLESYINYAKILLEKGYAYSDPYSEEELEQFRKQSKSENKPFLFRNYRPDILPKWDGKKPLRFKVPEIKEYSWYDLVRGELRAGEEALDDFILIKGDGYPTYNFAHIVDDLQMNVTHIFRADEFISSTPKFLSLYDALGIDHPAFVTLPPIMGPDGKKKLGKRDGAKDVLTYREEGYLKEAFVNFLAFIGWNPGTEKELFTNEEFVSEFSIEKIHTGGAKFNEQKLDWYNAQYIKNLSVSEKKVEIVKYLQKYKKDNWNVLDIHDSLIDLIVERIKKWSDIKTMIADGDLDYFFEEPVLIKDRILWKDDKNIEILDKHFDNVIQIINNLSTQDYNVKMIKTELIKYADKVGRGSMLWPIRYSLTGKEKSPDPFTLIEILGKKKSIERWKKAQNILKNI